MIKFNDYLTIRKVENQLGPLSQFLAEAAGVTVDQAKAQIMQILGTIPADTLENATAKLTFLDQLMKQGAQALPELGNLYKQEYPKLQQLQQQQGGAAQPQQPQKAGAQAQPQAGAQPQANAQPAAGANTQ
jgi:DNA repair ATPase RecN